ncbi:MAG: hypothetical protein JXA36_08130 [Coriobacteriia bacterium]|nr:hypothetical protein [Coriobacteriia bacterium]
MKTGTRRLITLTAACLLLAGMLGCDQPDQTVETSPAVTEEAAPETKGPLSESERVIGLTELGEGRVRAVGLLQYRASEGAIWVIVDGVAGQEAPADAPVIAVIENMYDLDSACSTSGALVYAEGTLAEDDSSGPGPALTAEFVARADEPQ